MSLMSQVLKFVDSQKVHQSKYLENRTLFFSSNNKINSFHIKGCNVKKNNFLAEVAFSKFEIAVFVVIKYEIGPPSLCLPYKNLAPPKSMIYFVCFTKNKNERRLKLW